MGNRKIIDFSLKGHFPSNLRGGEGPKACGDHSRQTNHQNWGLQIFGK